MSEIQRNTDRTGESNPMVGKTLSEKTKALMSEAKSSENNTRGMLGKYKKVFVYSFDSVSKEITLYKSFDNTTEATKHSDCTGGP